MCIPVLHIFNTHKILQYAIVPRGNSSLELWEELMEVRSIIYLHNSTRVKMDRDTAF